MDSNPDILSLSALDGKFFPFKDEAVIQHLGIQDFDKVHVLDSDMGSWVTHLRSSPAVRITANCTVHMKSRAVKMDPKVAITSILNSARPPYNVKSTECCQQPGTIGFQFDSGSTPPGNTVPLLISVPASSKFKARYSSYA